MNGTAVTPMAKKAEKNQSPSSESEQSGRKPMVVQIRGSAEWKLWAESLAAHEGDTLAKFVERMMRRYAKENGLPDPPKR